MISRRRLLTTSFGLAATPVLFIPGAARNVERRPLDRSRLHLTFDEDFGGPLSFWNRKTRQGRWKTNWFYGTQDGPGGRISNGEIVVDGDYAGIDPFMKTTGDVRLTLARTQSTDPRLGGKKLTAGLLTTERSFSQTYGYFECRMATPRVPGCWPAFWLYSVPVQDLTGTQPDNHLGFGREWSGGLNSEIDVVEILTNNLKETNHTASARHGWKDGRPGRGFDNAFRPSIAGTHVAANKGTDRPQSYGVLWTADEIVWYVDDAEVFRARNPGIHDPMYMIVSMGAGGWNGNVLLEDFVEAQLLVDFVRVYQLT